MKSDLAFYIEQFKSSQCWCGKEKREKNAFCYSCYKKLPSYLQRGLWNLITSQEFRDAYDEAVRHLEEC